MEVTRRSTQSSALTGLYNAFTQQLKRKQARFKVCSLLRFDQLINIKYTNHVIGCYSSVLRYCRYSSARLQTCGCAGDIQSPRPGSRRCFKAAGLSGRSADFNDLTGGSSPFSELCSWSEPFLPFFCIQVFSRYFTRKGGATQFKWSIWSKPQSIDQHSNDYRILGKFR